MTYDERLDHLLAKAAIVFADKGFHSTTMRDLSRASGMSLAGMYYYVRNKDDLLFRIQERCFTDVLAGARAAVEEPAVSAEERVSLFIRHHVEFFARHMAEMKVLSHEADSLAGERQATIDELKRQYVELLLTLLEAAGEDRAGVDPRVAAYALFGMMNWMYTWYDPAGPVAPDDLAAQFATIYLRGVGAARHEPSRV